MSAADAFLGSLLRLGLTWLSRGRQPKIDGQLTLPGLDGSAAATTMTWPRCGSAVSITPCYGLGSRWKHTLRGGCDSNHEDAGQGKGGSS